MSLESLCIRHVGRARIDWSRVPEDRPANVSRVQNSQSPGQLRCSEAHKAAHLWVICPTCCVGRGRAVRGSQPYVRSESSIVYKQYNGRSGEPGDSGTLETLHDGLQKVIQERHSDCIVGRNQPERLHEKPKTAGIESNCTCVKSDDNEWSDLTG